MKADGSLKHGSGLSGTKIGSIKTAHFNKCFLLGITYTASHTPWDLNAKSYDASTHVTHGTISGIDLSFSGAGCVGQIDGTAAAADDGVLPVAYTNSTGKLAIGRGGNLHYYKISGCIGLFKSGDTVTITGKAAVTPAQMISSP